MSAIDETRIVETTEEREIPKGADKDRGSKTNSPRRVILPGDILAKQRQLAEVLKQAVAGVDSPNLSEN